MRSETERGAAGQRGCDKGEIIALAMNMIRINPGRIPCEGENRAAAGAERWWRGPWRGQDGPCPRTQAHTRTARAAGLLPV